MPIYWDKFSEIEVQGILYQHFLSLNYKVDWVHFIEPSKERKLGCDLVCRKNGETIGVAVKKKPGIRDCEQVKRLAQKNYDRKLFIYLKTPSISFTEKIGKYTSKVEVLSLSNFEKELENHETGLMILSYIHYSDSLFSKLTAKFLLELANLIEEKTTDNLQRETIKPMPELWQLKDYTAAMSRSIQLLLSISEKDWFYAETEPKVLYFIFQEVLNSLGSMMEGFYQTWQRLTLKDKMLVLKTHAKYGNRSNWLGLRNFEFYLKQSCIYSPGKLKHNLNQLGKIDKAKYEKAEREFSETIRKLGKVWIPRPIMTEFLTEDFLRPHFNFLYSLEGLVDQMFEL